MAIHDNFSWNCFWSICSYLFFIMDLFIKYVTQKMAFFEPPPAFGLKQILLAFLVILSSIFMQVHWIPCYQHMYTRQLYILFFYLDFLSRDTQDSLDSQGKGRPFLTTLYCFHPLREHYLHINRVITSDNSPCS